MSPRSQEEQVLEKGTGQSGRNTPCSLGKVASPALGKGDELSRPAQVAVPGTGRNTAGGDPPVQVTNSDFETYLSGARGLNTYLIIN